MKEEYKLEMIGDPIANKELIKLYNGNRDKIVKINDTPILHIKENINNIYIQVSHEKPYSMRKVTIAGGTYEDLMKEFSDGPESLTINFEDSYFRLSDEEYKLLK